MANWIKGAIKKPGSFTAQAKTRGMSPAEFQSKVLSNPGNYSPTTVKRANLRKTLVGMESGGKLTEYGMGGNITGQQGSAVQQGIGAAGPWGAAIGAVSGIGVGIGNSIGGDTGGAISGMADPAAILQDKNLSMSKRLIGAAVPMLGGIWSARERKKDAQEAERVQDYQRSMQRGQAKLANMDPQQQYAASFAYGGETPPGNTPTTYAKNILGINTAVSKNLLNNKELDESTRATAYYTGKDLLKEIPHNMEGITNRRNLNEMAYLNDLYSRVKPAMSDENIQTLVKGNSPVNVYKKYKVLDQTDLYKSDLDSLKKYTPEFYDKYNLELAKPFLKNKKMAKGGKVPRNTDKGDMEYFAKGDTQAVNKTEYLRNQAEYNYLINKATASMDSAKLADYSKGAPLDINESLKYADAYAKNNPDFYSNLDMLSDTEKNRLRQLTPIMEQQYGVSSTGTKDYPDAVGARMLSFTNPAVQWRGIEDAQSKERVHDIKYEMKYSPEEGYQSTPVELKKGPLYRAPRYAMGGMAGMPNVELEGGESVATPQGANMEVNGPSHAQGGVPMNLPPATKVFSDRLRMPGTKKTYSDINKPLAKEINKYQEILDNPRATRLAKSTAEKMLTKAESKQEMLFNSQQMMNGDSNGSMDGMLPKGYDGMQVINRRASDFSFNQPDATTLAPMQTSSAAELTNNGNGLRGVGSFIKSNIGTVAQAAPILYNIGQGLFGKAEKLDPSDYYNPYEGTALSALRNRRINVDPLLSANRTAFNIANRNVSTAARTRGEMLSAYGANAAGRATADSQVLANAQNVNNQYLGEYAQTAANLGAQRASTNYAVGQQNAANRMVKQNAIGKGLGQLSNYVQMQQLIKGQQSNDQLRINALKGIVPHYDPITGEYLG